jgi:hypothetical protein
LNGRLNLAISFGGVKPDNSLSRVNQDGKRDNQDGKFFKGVVFEHFGSDLAL